MPQDYGRANPWWRAKVFTGIHEYCEYEYARYSYSYYSYSQLVSFGCYQNFDSSRSGFIDTPVRTFQFEYDLFYSRYNKWARETLLWPGERTLLDEVSRRKIL